MPAKKNLVLHIGDAKTGTSSIQSYLTRNREALEAAGILYSKVGLLAENGIANHRLAQCINILRPDDHNARLKLYNDLYKEASESNCSTILISSEGFCSLRTKDEILNLKLCLKDFNVKVVAYLRRPDVWLESWYGQIVKDYPFSTSTFLNYLNNHQEPSLTTALKYSDVFGITNTVLRPFERKKMTNMDVVDDFLNIMEFKKIGEDKVDANISPDIYTTELIRLLNKTLDIPRHARSNLNNSIAKKISLSDRHNYFSFSERERVLQKYSHEISILDKKFSQDGLFFTQPEEDSEGKEVSHFCPNLGDKMISVRQLTSFIKHFFESK